MDGYYDPSPKHRHYEAYERRAQAQAQRNAARSALTQRLIKEAEDRAAIGLLERTRQLGIDPRRLSMARYLVEAQHISEWPDTNHLLYAEALGQDIHPNYKLRRSLV